MVPLHIEGTQISPTVAFDPKQGIFKISGRSLLDKKEDFYEPVLTWMKDYALIHSGDLSFVFHFEYINTVSLKAVLNLLTILEKIPSAKVTWLFNKKKEDIEEVGTELAELVKVPFILSPV